MMKTRSCSIKTHGSESRGQERVKQLPKQNARQTTVCLLHEQTFSSFEIIITLNISRAVSTFKPALKTQNLLANINQHPKDKSNRLISLSFPAWSKSMNFVFTFLLLLLFDGSSQFSFLNRHISLRLAVLLGLLM